ncbi:LOW QUALITY PROTEIN: hypothetical protein HID58_047963 [Brassica napus]|uniref:Uncharacterized protein n=1 Tax=Brassica napus TaxID=3708 RepID=A0ABQ8B0R9_BRANA|nr:LOW QUALITY PROTEIN: hypothetical protein HID58_047963 [Brassica napus]
MIDFDACHGNPRLRLSSLTRMQLISGWDCLPPSSCLSFLRRVSDVHLFTTVTFKAHDEQPSQLPKSSISPQIAEDSLCFLIGPVTAKKYTAAGSLKSKNPTGSKSSISSFEDDDDGFVVRKNQRVEDVDLSGGERSSCRELARAILKLGEVYERIEGAKMMIELDKPMMEAAKELELWSLKDPSLASVELLLHVRSCRD